MSVQSVSICCPGKKCINNCMTCTVPQHANPYRDLYNGSPMEVYRYWKSVENLLEQAREEGVGTLMITGSNEPQQDKRWLQTLSIVLRNLKNPFRKVEIQSTGALIDYEYLQFMKEALGLTTFAISVFNIINAEINTKIERSADKLLSVKMLCENCRKLDINIRICLNVTDHFVDDDIHPASELSIKEQVAKAFDRCKELGANQVTFRKMWAANDTCPQGKWIKENCTHSDEIIEEVKRVVKNDGIYLNTLEYGAKRYDYRGMSLVIDEDSMSQNKDTGIKYYIIRPDGHMYSSWNLEGSREN